MGRRFVVQGDTLVDATNEDVRARSLRKVAEQRKHESTSPGVARPGRDADGPATPTVASQRVVTDAPSPGRPLATEPPS
jgi:hypothetical protein